MAKASFTEGAARRVASATLRVERMSQANPLRRRQQLDPNRFYLGKTDAAINKGTSGTVSIYGGTTKGSETDTGNNMTVYNRYANVAAARWVTIMYIDSDWEMICGEC